MTGVEGFAVGIASFLKKDNFSPTIFHNFVEAKAAFDAEKRAVSAFLAHAEAVAAVFFKAVFPAVHPIDHRERLDAEAFVMALVEAEAVIADF